MGLTRDHDLFDEPLRHEVARRASTSGSRCVETLLGFEHELKLRQTGRGILVGLFGVPLSPAVMWIATLGAMAR